MEQRRQGIKPVFNIMRGRFKLPTSGLSYHDSVDEDTCYKKPTKDVYQLSSKRFFMDMLIGIRDEIRNDYRKYQVADAEKTKLISVIERDFETEYL